MVAGCRGWRRRVREPTDALQAVVGRAVGEQPAPRDSDEEVTLVDDGRAGLASSILESASATGVSSESTTRGGAMKWVTASDPRSGMLRCSRCAGESARLFNWLR